MGLSWRTQVPLNIQNTQEKPTCYRIGNPEAGSRERPKDSWKIRLAITSQYIKASSRWRGHYS